MKQSLTPEQERIIIDNKLNDIAQVSMRLDRALHADIYKLYLDNPDRFNNFSAFAREAFRCLLLYGLDWRLNQSDNGKLDQLIGMVRNLKGVVVAGDVVAAGEAANELIEKIDDSGGFSIE